MVKRSIKSKYWARLVRKRSTWSTLRNNWRQTGRIMSGNTSNNSLLPISTGLRSTLPEKLDAKQAQRRLKKLQNIAAFLGREIQIKLKSKTKTFRYVRKYSKRATARSKKSSTKTWTWFWRIRVSSWSQRLRRLPMIPQMQRAVKT